MSAVWSACATVPLATFDTYLLSSGTMPPPDCNPDPARQVSAVPLSLRFRLLQHDSGIAELAELRDGDSGSIFDDGGSALVFSTVKEHPTVAPRAFTAGTCGWASVGVWTQRMGPVGGAAGTGHLVVEGYETRLAVPDDVPAQGTDTHRESHRSKSQAVRPRRLPCHAMPCPARCAPPRPALP